MTSKKLLIKLSKEGRIDCSPSCPLYYIICFDEKQLDEMYLYLTKKQKDFNNNMFSSCSEIFLQLCYKFDKEMAKEMFEKYADNGNNFYITGKRMPCNLLKEMSEFMLQKRKLIDIE